MRVTREEELRVITRIQMGEAEAFETLVLAHQRKVYSLCLRMTGNAEDAEDLAQEAFVRAYQSISSFKGESGFGSWLYRLAKNICIDFLRREKRREKSSLTYLDEAGNAMDLEVPDERFTPESVFEQRQMAEAIERGLDTLTSEHRDILILREIEGKSYDEIAEALNLTAGTVKSRISRARMVLCKFLLDDGNFSLVNSSKQTKTQGKEGQS